FVELKTDVQQRYGRMLLESQHWLQRRTKYGDLADATLALALENLDAAVERGVDQAPSLAAGALLSDRLAGFVADVREEYFTGLGHLLDSRYYRTHGAGADPVTGKPAATPAGKYAAKRRGYVVSIGEDLGAIKISGWTHTIPEYFDFDRFWKGYPGAREN